MRKGAYSGQASSIKSVVSKIYIFNNMQQLVHMRGSSNMSSNVHNQFHAQTSHLYCDNSAAAQVQCPDKAVNGESVHTVVEMTYKFTFVSSCTQVVEVNN